MARTAPPNPPRTPPPTRRGDDVDDYHGTSVADPYRWLEDPDSDETAAWVGAQNEVAFAHLGDLAAREPLRRRLAELWDHGRVGTPWRRGDTYFRFTNPGLADQDLLECADDVRAGRWRTLLDPNELSDDGTRSLSVASVSRDGRYLAYAVSDGGSDWQTWHVRDVATGEDLDDVLEWGKFSGAAWAPDSSGFFYGRFPEPAEGEELTSANFGQQLWFHTVGTGQDADRLVYENPDEPRWTFGPTVTFDGRHLVLTVSRDTGTESLLLVAPIHDAGRVEEDRGFVALTPAFEASYQYVANDGDRFHLLTDAEAPLGRLVTVDLATPDGAAVEVVAEGSDRLEWVCDVPGGFLLLSLHDASHRLARIERDGTGRREIELPTLGSIVGLQTRPDDTEVFIGFSSFLFPTTPYRLDLDSPDLGSGALEALASPGITFDPAGYQTSQRFATSRDGTRVPYFVVHRRGLDLDGSNPTLLYGYGGFDISITPAFATSVVPWLEAGGVYAVATLRGGGEYGDEWHRAGTLDRKQNVFDDFIACAEDLIAAGYTRPDRLAVEGRSNGGLLVGAVITQRPDLFGAAHAAVGVMDMLRFHRFTIGWAWTSDYGCADDDADQFATLLAYSPLHNLREGTAYPATIITTGDHDDRVVPAHSFKFTAEMQRCQAGDAPIIARIQTRAGHGMGKPTSVIIAEQADVTAFLLDALDVDAAGDAGAD
ncbi:MAG: prolyl oligopeptidase family serine peptidase [Actinomycetota bacterium]|nr:prolyl oligopeptidase family serine peptidase [Actinomycetota bacterium]